MRTLAAMQDVTQIDTAMEMEIKSVAIQDAETFEQFRGLLKQAGLPYNDLTFEKNLLLGYYDDETLIGSGALEIYGKYALLRSLAVNDANRGRSLGSKITDDLIQLAKKNGIKRIYLLTESARLFFKRKGFRDVSRDQVPEEVRASSEFSSVCPDSAVCMEYAVPEL